MTAIQRVISAYGNSQAEIARELGISGAAVARWAAGVDKVPLLRCIALERGSTARGDRVTCEELRPDIDWASIRSLGAKPHTPRTKREPNDTTAA